MARHTGLPSATMGTLIRPTVPLADGNEQADTGDGSGEQGGEPPNGRPEGAGDASRPPARRRVTRSI